MKYLHMKYLDNNHYIISSKAAYHLGRHYCPTPYPKPVPADGMERRIRIGSLTFWLKKTRNNGSMVWALHHDYDLFNVAGTDLYRTVTKCGKIQLKEEN